MKPTLEKIAPQRGVSGLEMRAVISGGDIVHARESTSMNGGTQSTRKGVRVQ